LGEDLQVAVVVLEVAATLGRLVAEGDQMEGAGLV
jgi:hypothetical protein